MKEIFFSGKSDKSTSFYFKKLIVVSIRPTTSITHLFNLNRYDKILSCLTHIL